MPRTRHFQFESIIPAEPSALWEWHVRPGAFRKLTPWWAPAQVVSPSAPSRLEADTRLTLRVFMGPIPVKWIAHHRNFDPPHSFMDVQESGPFRSWEHTHSFISHGGAGTVYRDSIDYSLPMPDFLGDAVNLIFRLQLWFLFRHRHSVVLKDFS